jgi:cupin fold WbuC family metalloprotein
MFKFVKSKNSLTLNKFLKKKLKKNESVFRYNFHKNNNDTNQLMMIWQKKNYFFSPKKFLDSHKIYILMRGKLNIYIFNSKGKLLKLHKLTKDDPICRLNKNTFHADVAKTPQAVHCEITNHSFNKRKIIFLEKKYYSKVKKILIS